MASPDDNLSAGEAEYDAHSAVGAVVDAARNEAGEVIAAVVADAQQQIQTAEEIAAEMARAAMETHLGQQITTLRNEVNEWRVEQGGLSATVATMQQQISELTAQLSATATLTVAAITEPVTEPLSLTPPTSEGLTEAITEVQQVIPEALAPVAVVESPAVPRKRRWL